MIAWPLRTTQAPKSTATTSATSPMKIVPDEGLAPGRLDMGLLDLVRHRRHAGGHRAGETGYGQWPRSERLSGRGPFYPERRARGTLRGVGRERATMSR